MKLISTDNKTSKFLVDIGGGTCVETTYVDYENKHIVCFSSMAGCPVGCTFCVSGQNQAYRMLTISEMVMQCQEALEGKDLSTKPILFSCMGEGEPLLNYKNVVAALKTLSNLYSGSKLALSTSGTKPHLLKELAKEEFNAPFKLQISVHSTFEHIRTLLMPHAGPLSGVKVYMADYMKSGKDIEFNYVLIDGMNDQAIDAVRLADFVAGKTIKLNMLNPTPNNSHQFTTNFDRFCEVLDDKGANYEFYATDGTDINAACGQLSYKQKS